MARLMLMLNLLEEANRVDILNRRIQRMNRYITRSLAMGSAEFRRNFRLTKELYYMLVQDLSPYMKQPTRRQTIKCKVKYYYLWPDVSHHVAMGMVAGSDHAHCNMVRNVRPKILVALSFYATGSCQVIVGRSNGIKMPRLFVSKAIKEVTSALNHRNILIKYMRFPQSAEERNFIKRRFFTKFQIPSVIGCIDGTHVSIIRPAEHEEIYFNRRNYYSRNVQIICDSDLNILNADATFGGATRDSFIFNQHPVKAHLAELSQKGETVYLLGDSGYCLREYLMTPVLNAENGSPEDYYSQKHCAARNTVKQTIGLLKARWHCLLRHKVLRYDPITSSRIIYACCVLHNLCNKNNSPEIHTAEANEVSGNNILSTFPMTGDELRRGQATRQHLITSICRNRRL